MDIYGLIGYPLGHSFSISYFNEKFQNENINARYVNFEIPNIEDLREVLDSNPDLKGLNVTIPYKQKVIPYLDEVSPEARAIGAVNVIRITRKGKNVKLKGFNSDATTSTPCCSPWSAPARMIKGRERRLRPTTSANTTSSSTVRRSACTQRSTPVRTCPTRP